MKKVTKKLELNKVSLTKIESSPIKGGFTSYCSLPKTMVGCNITVACL